MFSEITGIPDYAIWTLVVALALILVTQAVRRANEKNDKRVEAERLKRAKAEEDRRKAEEAARRVEEINAAKHNQFINEIDAIIAQLGPRTHPVSVYAESMRKFPFVARTFAETLPPERRTEFEKGWESYRSLAIPAPRPASGRVEDWSAGTAVVLAALKHLRSFAEWQEPSK